MRIFYVIYIKDEILGSYLNAIRYLGNPNEKNDAHITVRGAYKKSLNNIQKYNSIVKGDKVIIRSVGKFFDKDQNTVYLTCESKNLKKVWQKFDYGFNPHITLYDGKSRDFAIKLVEILNSHLINFTFIVNELSELRIMKGQSDYRLRLDANIGYIKLIIGSKLSHNDVEKMGEQKRLELIDKLTFNLSFIKAKKKLAITLQEKEEEANYNLNLLNEEENENISYLRKIVSEGIPFDLKVLRNL